MKARILFSEKYSLLTAEENLLVLQACREVEKYVKRSAKTGDQKIRTRDVHAKSYGEVFGTLKISESGDRYIREVFPAHQYRTVLRVSNVTMVAEEGKDRLPAYGIAVKLMNVTDGLDVNLPLANFPVFPTNSVSKFLKLFIRINKMASAAAKFKPLAIFKAPPVMLSSLSFIPNFIDASFLKHFGNVLYNRNRNPLAFNYHSIGCYRFGNYIVKFLLEPVDFPKSKLKIGEKSQKQAVQDAVKNISTEYSLKMQYCRKEDWINDLTVVWPRKKFREIGRIKIEPASLLNPQKVETLSFSPFENPDILKPVGRIQKTRELVYRTSVAARQNSI